MKNNFIIDNEDFTHINERFPHIGCRIHFMWGQRSCTEFINHVLNDTRNGTRSGFPIEIGAALIRLLLLHEEQFPDTRIEKPWANILKRS